MAQNITHIGLHLKEIKEAHCKSAYNLMTVMDSVMERAFEDLSNLPANGESAIKMLSQAVKYCVLSVFEYRSCTLYLNKMKIEGDFQFYEDLQNVFPEEKRTKRFCKDAVVILFTSLAMIINLFAMLAALLLELCHNFSLLFMRLYQT